MNNTQGLPAQFARLKQNFFLFPHKTGHFQIKYKLCLSLSFISRALDVSHLHYDGYARILSNMAEQ